MTPFPVASVPVLVAALVSALLLTSVLPAFALGKSPLAEPARRIQSAPNAAEEWAAIDSQAAVAANAALKAAGIDIPFPQRDVTLRFPPQEET